MSVIVTPNQKKNQLYVKPVEAMTFKKSVDVVVLLLVMKEFVLIVENMYE